MTKHHELVAGHETIHWGCNFFMPLRGTPKNIEG